MTSTNVHTITNPQAQRVCSLAGISVAQKQLVTFEELKKGIDVSLRDLDTQRKSEALVDKAFMVARFTKATCDAFIGMAAELSGSKAAKMVKGGYGIASNVAEASATAATGGKVDYGKAATGILKGTAEIVGAKGPGTALKGAGVTDKAAEYIVNSTAVKGDLVIGAMNADSKQIKKSAVEYGVELAKYTLDELEKEQAKRFVAIAKEAFDFNENIGDAIDDYYKSRDESIQRYFDLKTTLVRQARQVQKKIDDLKGFLDSCSRPIAPPPVQSRPVDDMPLV